MTSDNQKIIHWLLSDDTGISSKALVGEYLCAPENERWGIGAPLDPSDLGRCLRLIYLVPAIRGCVDSLALKHENWARAAKIWDKISQSMIEEVGIDWEKSKSAPLTFALMKDAGL